MHCAVVSWVTKCVLEIVEHWSSFDALWQATNQTHCMRLRGVNKVYLPPRTQERWQATKTHCRRLRGVNKLRSQGNFSRHYVTNTPMITWLDGSSPVCLSLTLDPDRVETLTRPLLCYSVEPSSFKPADAAKKRLNLTPKQRTGGNCVRSANSKWSLDL